MDQIWLWDRLTEDIKKMPIRMNLGVLGSAGSCNIIHVHQIYFFSSNAEGKSSGPLMSP